VSIASASRPGTAQSSVRAMSRPGTATFSRPGTAKSSFARPGLSSALSRDATLEHEGDLGFDHNGFDVFEELSEDGSSEVEVEAKSCAESLVTILHKELHDESANVEQIREAGSESPNATVGDQPMEPMPDPSAKDVAQGLDEALPEEGRKMEPLPKTALPSRESTFATDTPLKATAPPAEATAAKVEVQRPSLRQRARSIFAEAGREGRLHLALKSVLKPQEAPPSLRRRALDMLVRESSSGRLQLVLAKHAPAAQAALMVVGQSTDLMEPLPDVDVCKSSELGTPAAMAPELVVAGPDQAKGLEAGSEPPDSAMVAGQFRDPIESLLPNSVADVAKSSALGVHDVPAVAAAKACSATALCQAGDVANGVEADKPDEHLESVPKQAPKAETKPHLPADVANSDDMVKHVLLVDRIKLLRAESAKIRAKIFDTEAKSQRIDELQQRCEQPLHAVVGSAAAHELQAALVAKARLAEAKCTMASLNVALKEEATRLDETLQALLRRRDDMLTGGAAHRCVPAVFPE